jgi:hypothetical protein
VDDSTIAHTIRDGKRNTQTQDTGNQERGLQSAFR